jgi:hypothetical protein
MVNSVVALAQDLTRLIRLEPTALNGFHGTSANGRNMRANHHGKVNFTTEEHHIPP